MDYYSFTDPNGMEGRVGQVGTVTHSGPWNGHMSTI